MDLSAKMPATQDPKMAARMPARMESKATPAGGGSMTPPETPIVNSSSYTGDCDTRDVGNGGYSSEDRKQSSGWETADRKN